MYKWRLFWKEDAGKIMEGRRHAATLFQNPKNYYDWTDDRAGGKLFSGVIKVPLEELTFEGDQLVLSGEPAVATEFIGSGQFGEVYKYIFPRTTPSFQRG